jgi:hypothetical protein
MQSNIWKFSDITRLANNGNNWSCGRRPFKTSMRSCASILTRRALSTVAVFSFMLSIPFHGHTLTSEIPLTTYPQFSTGCLNCNVRGFTSAWSGQMIPHRAFRDRLGKDPYVGAVHRYKACNILLTAAMDTITCHHRSNLGARASAYNANPSRCFREKKTSEVSVKNDIIILRLLSHSEEHSVVMAGRDCR